MNNKTSRTSKTSKSELDTSPASPNEAHNSFRIYQKEPIKTPEPSLHQPTLLDRAEDRGGKINGKLDPRILAAKERAQAALIRAQQSKQEILKSDLDLQVSNKDYVDSARAHPISTDMDKRIPKVTQADMEETINYPANLVHGAGDSLKLSRIGEQALKMLGTGLKPSIVATALSVSPAYISQLLADEDFAKAVTERKITTLTKANEHDDNLHEVEELALRKLKTSLEFTNKPMEVARIFNIVNNAKRRGAGNLDEGNVDDGRTTVVLTLPGAARVKLGLQVEVNDLNQVTTVGNQQLGAIDPKHLMEVYRQGGNLVEGVATRVDQNKKAEKVVARHVHAAKQDASDLNPQVSIGEINLDDL